MIQTAEMFKKIKSLFVVVDAEGNAESVNSNPADKTDSSSTLAIATQYLFYSYGDACLLLPHEV